MIRIRTLTLSAIAVSAIAIRSVSVAAQNPQQPTQTNPPRSKSTVISLSIVLPKDQLLVGEKPWALLTVKNLTNEEIAFPQDRVYVEGGSGEPPTTLRQRQLTHRRRAGEPSLSGSDFEPVIEPGESFTRKYDLSELYDLSKPGRYIVYIDVLDASHVNGWKGGWVRSPIAHFQILTPTH